MPNNYGLSSLSMHMWPYSNIKLFFFFQFQLNVNPSLLDYTSSDFPFAVNPDILSSLFFSEGDKLTFSSLPLPCPIFPSWHFRNKGLLSRIHQHCLFYSDPAHHHLRKWCKPKPSLQRRPPQSQGLSSTKGTTHPGRKPWVSATTPVQSPYAPASEYTSHSLWRRRGWS